MRPKTMNDTDTVRRRNRLKLILVATIFLLPVMVAAGLIMSGWQPGTKSHGEPILPQRSFAKVPVTLTDGSRYLWRDAQPRWTLLALPGSDCLDNCRRLLTLMSNARIVLNKNADLLRLLYVGEPPHASAASALMQSWQVGHDTNGQLQAFRPAGPDSVAAILVEPNGTALVRYRAGFDPTGLRLDLQKVVK